MARLRSSAHFGTTRSGQRCMARCAQSYLPMQSASQVDFSSFCHGLCWGTRRQSGAKLMITPSSRSGFQSGATRFTSSRKARNSSTKASCASIALRARRSCDQRPLSSEALFRDMNSHISCAYRRCWRGCSFATRVPSRGRRMIHGFRSHEEAASRTLSAAASRMD